MDDGIPADAIAFAGAHVSDQASLNAAVDHCPTVLGEPDCLIASAGIVQPELLDRQAALDFDRRNAIHMTGTANAVRALYPAMIQRGAGKIMIIVSGAAVVAIPAIAPIAH